MSSIAIKTIESERLGDAPFIGALLSATTCTVNCPGCFNQHLKDKPNMYGTTEQLIDIVQQNPLHEGIILGGLEWTESPKEMESLILGALYRDLAVMLYTSMTEGQFRERFPQLCKLPIWIKFGPYIHGLSDVMDPSGIQLASSNQYVLFMGDADD